MQPEVTLKIDALDNTKQALQSVAKNIEGVQKQTKSFSSQIEALQPTFKRMAVGGAAAATAVGFAMKRLVSEGLKSQQIAESFDRMTAEMGYSGDELISKLQEVSAGTVDMTNLMLASNKAMALGVGTDIETMTTLMEIARVKGRALGLDTTQAFNDIVTGIGRGSPLILDNLGITIKLGAAQEIYAAQLGKTAAELTDVEKKNALLNAVLASGREELEAIGDVTLTSAERMQQLSAQIANMRSTLGEAFLPVLEQVVNAIQPLLERLATWIEQNPELARNIILTTAAIAGIVVVAGTLGLLLPSLITGFGALVSLLAVLKIALLAVSSPVGLIVAGIALLAFTIYKFRSQIAEFFSFWSTVWSAIPGPIQAAINIILFPLRAFLEGLRLTKEMLADFFNWTVTAARGTESLQSIVSRFADPLAGQSKMVSNFANSISEVTSESKAASENIKKLKDEARSIFGNVADDEVEANRQMAETIVEQEQSLTEKKRELRRLERDTDSDTNENRIEELRYTIQQETEALQSFKTLKQTLSTEIAEAERRASLSAFERKMEDLLRERAARLQAQVARLKEIQQEILAEKSKSNTIAGVFQAGQERMQSAIKATSEVAQKEADKMRRAFASVFDNMPSYGSPAIRNLTSSSVRRVNDAIISPKGDIISTHPDDWLMAFKNPGDIAAAAGGSGGVTINISGTFLDDRAAARRMGDEIMHTLKQQMRL